MMSIEEGHGNIAIETQENTDDIVGKNLHVNTEKQFRIRDTDTSLPHLTRIDIGNC